MAKPFDQEAMWAPHDVGCTYFGARDDDYMLVLTDPVVDETNTIAIYAEEAVDLAEGEVDDEDLQIVMRRLRKFEAMAKQLTLVAAIREKREWVTQVDFFQDADGWIWADAHGDDTDSSQYIPRLSRSLTAVRDLWLRFSRSSLAQTNDWSFHRLLFDGQWRAEHLPPLKRALVYMASRWQLDEVNDNAHDRDTNIKRLELELWASMTAGFHLGVVNLADICSGSHPFTGIGPLPLGLGGSDIPVSDSDGDEW